MAVRKTLQLYLWKNRKFIEFGQDISLHDVPRSLAWRDNSLCIGYRSEYCLIKLSTLDKVELFPTGKSQENTSVTLMSDDRFALGKDDQTKFVDLTGSLALDSITWSETPFQGKSKLLNRHYRSQPHSVSRSKITDLDTSMPNCNVHGGRLKPLNIFGPDSLPAQPQYPCTLCLIFTLKTRHTAQYGC